MYSIIYMVGHKDEGLGAIPENDFGRLPRISTTAIGNWEFLNPLAVARRSPTTGIVGLRILAF